MGNPDIIKTGGAGKGRADLIKHLKGGRLYQTQAIRAKCYECMLGYADGPGDCQTPRCPLYRYMPYHCKEKIIADQSYHEMGKLAKGQSDLVAHMQGSRISSRGAILAKGYDCMGGYLDGKCNCKITACPLYPWMPYKNIECPKDRE